MTSEHLNSDSAAHKLNISIEKLAELREQGLISAEKTDDDWQYSLGSLEAYLSQSTSTADSQAKLAEELTKESQSSTQRLKMPDVGAESHESDPSGDISVDQNSDAENESSKALTRTDSDVEAIKPEVSSDESQSDLAQNIIDKGEQSQTKRIELPDNQAQDTTNLQEQQETADHIAPASQQNATQKLQQPANQEPATPEADSDDSGNLPEYTTKPGVIDSAIFEAPESAELDALDSVDSSQFEKPEPSSRLSDEYRTMPAETEERFDTSDLDSDIHSDDTGNEDSALILGDELDLDSDGATMIQSGKQMEEAFAAEEFDQSGDADEIDSGIELIDDPASEGAEDDSGITLDSESEVEALEDSGITLAGSGVIADEASAIVLDAESGVVIDNDNDSGISLEADSGIALEMTSVLDEDSDSNLADDDSGIALSSAEDSGIALEEAMVVDDDDDSGIALLAEESGIALLAEDSEEGAVADPVGTQRMVSPYAEPDEDELALEALEADVEMDATSRLENPFEQENEFASQADSASDVQFSDGTGSEEMEILDESGEFDEYDEHSPDLEEPAFFDDAGDLLDEDELSGEFASESSGASSVDMRPDARPVPQTIVKAPEAEWGAMAFVGLLACMLILVANGIVAWQGLRTLQTGNVEPAVTDSIVNMILNAIK